MSLPEEKPKLSQNFVVFRHFSLEYSLLIMEINMSNGLQKFLKSFLHTPTLHIKNCATILLTGEGNRQQKASTTMLAADVST